MEFPPATKLRRALERAKIRVVNSPEASNYPSKALVALGAGVLLVVACVLVATLGRLERPALPASQPGQAPSPSPPGDYTAPESERPGTTDEILRDGESEAVGSVQALRGLPQAELVANLRGGKPLIRVASLTILWERGQRDLVREHAAGHPLLEAQLRALESRSR